MYCQCNDTCMLCVANIILFASLFTLSRDIKLVYNGVGVIKFEKRRLGVNYLKKASLKFIEYILS